MVTIIAKIVTKLDRNKYTYSCEYQRTSYTTLVATQTETGFTSESKWSGVVASGV